MKCLQRNQQLSYYALYGGKTAIVDGNGNRTGEFTTAFGSATPIYATISAARGTADLEEFGINLNYSKTLITDDMSCPIDEQSRLWLGLAVSEFSTTASYSVGSYVSKADNGVTKIYRCVSPVTAGAWVASKWQESVGNYYVVAVAKSLNYIKYALREVDVA